MEWPCKILWPSWGGAPTGQESPLGRTKDKQTTFHVRRSFPHTVRFLVLRTTLIPKETLSKVGTVCSTAMTTESHTEVAPRSHVGAMWLAGSQHPYQTSQVGSTASEQSSAPRSDPTPIVNWLLTEMQKCTLGKGHSSSINSAEEVDIHVQMNETQPISNPGQKIPQNAFTTQV